MGRRSLQFKTGCCFNLAPKYHVMTGNQTGATACHNCRRRRLKCDRSLPQCLKCIKTKQECLGYQRLFRWEQGIASRGKMAGKTYEGNALGQAPSISSSPDTQSPASHSSHSSSSDIDEIPLFRYVADPLVQDVDRGSWKYLSYCEQPMIPRPALHIN